MARIFTFIFCSALLWSCNRQEKEEAANVFYTCSMDPQVMEKRPGKCPICKMELTRTIISPNENTNGIKLSDDQVQLANIKTAKPEYADMAADMTLRGIIVPEQNKVGIISSRASGRIDRLYYKVPGEKISKGDPVYKIYSEELQASINQYLLLSSKEKQLNTGSVNYHEMVKAARNKLLIWGLSENQIEALGDRDASDGIIFYSRYSGTVSGIPVSEGDYINEGTEILSITDYSTLWVEAQAYPADMKYIFPGAKVQVQVEGMPGLMTGKISFENPELEQESRVTLVRAEISNKEGRLKPGMRALVSLSSDKKKALAIPEDAVLQQPEANIVWIKKDDVFIRRIVETGSRSAGMVEISSGLEENDIVVISGVYLLDSEYKLRKGIGN